MNHGTTKEEPVRLLFEMTREDNPRLYDDLIRFNKGTKRVNHSVSASVLVRASR